MMKNISYLLFGGIKWRLKGFLIGVAVGLALGSFIPDWAMRWIPSASAAYEEYDLESINDYPVDPFNFNAHEFPKDLVNPEYEYSDSWPFVVSDDYDSFSITDVSMRLYRYAGIPPENDCPMIDCPQFDIRIYDAVPIDDQLDYPEAYYAPAPGTNGSPIFGTLLGSTQLIDYDSLSEFPLDYDGTLETLPDISTYVLYENFSGSLNFDPGDVFLVTLNTYWSGQTYRIGYMQSRNSLHVVDSTNIGLMLCNFNKDDCHTTPAPEDPMIAFNFDAPQQPVDWWQIDDGPYIADNQTQFDLGYYCFYAADIWGYDPSVDSDFQDLSVFCDDETGILDLPLSSPLTIWNLGVKPIASPNVVQDIYQIFITYDEDTPQLPNDYNPVDSGGFCLSVLQDDDFDNDEQGAVISGFFSVMSKFFDIPVLGDYLTFNCWIKAGIIDNLSDSDFDEIDLTITLLGDTDNLNLDLQATKMQLKNKFAENPNYDTFRSTVTMIFWGLIVYMIWHSYATHHKQSHPDEEH